jgi:hypothetical protein
LHFGSRYLCNKNSDKMSAIGLHFCGFIDWQIVCYNMQFFWKLTAYCLYNSMEEYALFNQTFVWQGFKLPYSSNICELYSIFFIVFFFFLFNTKTIINFKKKGKFVKCELQKLYKNHAKKFDFCLDKQFLLVTILGTGRFFIKKSNKRR